MTNATDQMSNHLHLPCPPAGVCEHCQRENEIAYDPESGMVVAYCPHNSAGAVFLPLANRWCIWMPITPVELAEYIGDLKKSEDIHPATPEGATVQ